jgi:hypothetical protein
MAKLENLKINGATVREIHNSGPMLALLGSEARKIASRAGAGEWNVHVERGPKRGRAAVVTGDKVAREREGRDRALSRAVGGVAGGGGGSETAAPRRTSSRPRNAQGRFI